MPVQGRESKPGHQAAIVTFRLGKQIYALPIAPVRQIIEMVTITPVPHAHRSVAGVINFHGALAPVINLGLHLGVGESPVELHTPILLVSLADHLLGLIVDQVLDVVTLPADQILAPQSTILQDMGEIALLQGLIFSPDGNILLLDLEHLFSAGYARALLEAAEVLNLQAKNELPAVETAPPAVETSPPEPEREAVPPAGPAPAPVRKTRSHSRKKSDGLPKDAPEVPA